jgi:hypothetical protein
LIALGLSLAAVRSFGAGLSAGANLCALVVAVLVPLRPPGLKPGLGSEFVAALPRQIAAVLVTGALLRFVLNQPLTGLWFGAVWPALGGLLGLDWPRIARGIAGASAALATGMARLGRAGRARVGRWIERQRWIRNRRFGEGLRAVLLLAAALWLMRGFARRTPSGGSDARWYAMVLADMVAQVRAGVFPVYAGQSLYQFNGAIYPLRIAPAYNYLGALLDTLTFRRLGTFELQNLLLILLGVGAMATAYLGLRALLPGRRWTAAALAAIFLSCPGVLGIAYNTDLFMSWTTLPLVPLVWFSTVRSFEDRGKPGTLALLGGSLGLCWWGHSPIALWSTLIAGAAQLVRICFQGRDGVSPAAVAAGVVVFGSVAAYPIGSVLFFPTEAGLHAQAFQRATAGNIARFIRQVFPRTFLPLSPEGRDLSDFQLGYSLWVLLAFSLWAQRRSRGRDLGVSLAAAAILAVLLLPIPGVDLRLWSLIPDFVRNTTGNWAMNRLYLPLAAATVFGTAACASAGLFAGRIRSRLLAFVLAAGCVWSFREAGKFAAGSRAATPAADSAADLVRPENVEITRFSYLVFPGIPGTFTHGVADPGLENRLLSREGFAPMVSDLEAAADSGHFEAGGDFVPNAAGNPKFVTLNTLFHIAPARSYLIQFDFAAPAATDGVLQIFGPHFFREYGLPEFGGPVAFGAGGDHAKVLSVWTTAGPQDLALRFNPLEPYSAGKAIPPVAHVRLLSYDRDSLPVLVDAWIPYRARVRSPSAAWLETPRMYQTGYHATVDRRAAEVRKSPEGLVCVAVPAGLSSVELRYVPPSGLGFLFWLSLVAIAAALALAAAGGWFHLRAARQSPERCDTR